ncbi:YHS domain-containing protein [Mycolicibacterium tusciae]|nr:YHS domain-containing protein [Mycolicibacterium tusciae]
MLLHRADGAAQTTWKGEEFSFCSETCKQAFVNHPDRFVTSQRG